MKKHTMLVATELSTEDMLEIFEALAAKLTKERNRVLELLQESERNFAMYRGAWLREMGGTIVRKSHEIDGFVLRTKELYEKAKKWDRQEAIALGRDPFWMVEEVKIESSDADGVLARAADGGLRGARGEVEGARAGDGIHGELDAAGF